MKIFAIVFSVLTLIACGGGGDGAGGNLTNTQVVPAARQATLCGIDVGDKILTGSVTSVHDGDTLTLNANGSSYQIRLDGIDAPELAQPFGSESRGALSSSVLGKSVRVAYTKQDQYGRTVGAVFTDSCQYVNLNQVATGMAWFYKAYQCELSATVRNQFAQAQSNAVAAKLGLWVQSEPEAPWFFRNGVEPVTPTCTSDFSSLTNSLALTAVGSSTNANTSSTVTVPSGSTTSTAICYTGPRGGTYTITASGNKNYSGC